MSLPPNTEEAVASSSDQKRFALSLFSQVMESVNVHASMTECFVVEGKVLRVGTNSIDLSLFSRVLLAAVGKAAVPMAQHALETLKPAVSVRGVVVGVGPWKAPEGIVYLEGGHPVPNENSFAAASALLNLARSADEDTLVVFLISGGTSAMAEAPFDPSISSEDLIAFYKALLHSGLPIGKANALRKHLSAIKGGRLALACGRATRCTLLISDVPPGRLDVVGSGLSLEDLSTVEECRKFLAETPAFAALPPRVQAFFASMPETPKSLPVGKLPSVCFSALSSDSLIQAAAAVASEAGYRVVVDNACDDWDYADASEYLLKRAEEEAASGMPVCILSAGEVTVSIDGNAGQGGRNQQWALETARRIAGRYGWAAMSAGSDGIDGSSPAAGAVVDAETWSRAEAAGLEPQRALRIFNTYPLFAALGDAIIPGPSGNNLRDLRVVLVNATL